MTIAEKSTELGIDLAQIALDNYGVAKCTHDGAFHCFTTKGGAAQNIYLNDDQGVKVHNGYFRWKDDTLDEASSLADVEAAFKAFIDGQEFNAVDTTDIQYEEIS
jgi:hypothetical protein